MMRTSGSWQDYSPYGSDVNGYFVEYDVAVPELDAVAGTGALTLPSFGLALAGERRMTPAA